MHENTLMDMTLRQLAQKIAPFFYAVYKSCREMQMQDPLENYLSATLNGSQKKGLPELSQDDVKGFLQTLGKVLSQMQTQKPNSYEQSGLKQQWYNGGKFLTDTEMIRQIAQGLSPEQVKSFLQSKWAHEGINSYCSNKDEQPAQNNPEKE